MIIFYRHALQSSLKYEILNVIRKYNYCNKNTHTHKHTPIQTQTGRKGKLVVMETKIQQKNPPKTKKYKSASWNTIMMIDLFLGFINIHP